MTAFVDTSVLYAVLDADDKRHQDATTALGEALGRERLVTTSYVVVETAALVQRRLGLPAVRDLLERLVPSFDVRWVDQELHEAGVDAMLSAGRRAVSLVDHVSFEHMRRRRIRTAVTLDRHFARAGFDLVPG